MIYHGVALKHESHQARQAQPKKLDIHNLEANLVAGNEDVEIIMVYGFNGYI